MNYQRSEAYNPLRHKLFSFIFLFLVYSCIKYFSNNKFNHESTGIVWNQNTVSFTSFHTFVSKEQGIVLSDVLFVEKH